MGSMGAQLPHLPSHPSLCRPQGWDENTFSVPQGSGMTIQKMTSGCPMVPVSREAALRRNFFTME